MRRVAGLCFLGALVMGAGPAPNSTLGRTPMLAQATISPSATYPSAPAQVASANSSGYTPAPVPDADDLAPVVRSTEPAQAEWSPNLFTGASTYRGEGYVPGSTVQGSQRRNIAPAPGVSLNVPLE